MPVFLSGRFDRTDKLTGEQQHDILICRIVLMTGWTIEYAETVSLEWIGKLLSYEAGVALIERTGSG